MALPDYSKQALLSKLYGVGTQPAAPLTGTNTLTPDVTANTTPAPKVSNPYTTPVYKQAPTPPPAEKQPPVTIVNNPVPPPTPPLANQTTYPENPMQEYWNANQSVAEGGPLSNVHTNPDGTISYTMGGQNFTKAPQDFNAMLQSYSSFGEQTYGNKPYEGAYAPTVGEKGVPLEGTNFGGSNTWPDVAQKLTAPPGEQNNQNAPPPPEAPPAAGGANQSPEGYKYLNAQGQPYNGEGTAYWYNTAEKKWYSGDKATNKITPLGSIAPWNTPPGGGNQNNPPGTPPGGGPPGAPQGVTYYGPGGGKYDPATDAKSYWYNAAEGIWYEGDTETGKISKKMGGPPWEDVTSDPRLSELIDKLSSMPYDQPYVDLMGGKLREQLQAGAGNTREELANRLGGAGVFGGAAQSQLRGVDAATALGMSQGMGNIYQTAMGNAYEDRRAALNALQGKEWQNVQKMLGGTNAELAMEQMNQSGMFRSQEDQTALAIQLLQMAQNASGNDQQMLYALATQLLSGTGSSILQGGV
jgi:hypothetical protein